MFCGISSTSTFASVHFINITFKDIYFIQRYTLLLIKFYTTNLLNNSIVTTQWTCIRLKMNNQKYELAKFHFFTRPSMSIEHCGCETINSVSLLNCLTKYIHLNQYLILVFKSCTQDLWQWTVVVYRLVLCLVKCIDNMIQPFQSLTLQRKMNE